MKRIIVIAGFIGGAALATAAPASAEPIDPDWLVGCAPAVTCKIAAVPEQTVNSLVALPGQFVGGVTSLPEDAANSFARLGDAPGKIASLPNDFATSIANLPGNFVGKIASLPSDAAASLAKPFGPVAAPD